MSGDRLRERTVLPASRPAAARASERLRMSIEVAVDLALCGALLAGLSFLAQHLQPDFPRLTFFTGVAGGGLCVLWAVLGRCGTRWCHVGAMVTLAPVACVLALQAVRSWAASGESESAGRPVTALMAVLVMFCVGMLANLAQERKGVQP